MNTELPRDFSIGLPRFFYYPDNFLFRFGAHSRSIDPFLYPGRLPGLFLPQPVLQMKNLLRPNFLLIRLEFALPDHDCIAVNIPAR